MKLLSVILVFALVLRIDQSTAKVRYDHYRVYKLSIQDSQQQLLLTILERLPRQISFWKEYDSHTKEVHVMVAPSTVNIFERLTQAFHTKAELFIENVQQLIDEEDRQNRESSVQSSGLEWTRYYPLADIEKWMDHILETYPQITEGFVLGTSYEKRTIRGMKISYKAGNPAIFIESNIHAREWITSASVTWFINELLTSTDPAVRHLAEDYDWYIVPVLNVDGFVYSHEKDRLWRKTRQPVENSNCIGTDMNRNFDFHWMENGGASSNPCSETFAGPKPYSEPEAKALIDYVRTLKDRLKIYIAFHSYGQYLLSPYGHSETEFPTNYNELLAIGKSFAESIESLPYKTKYTYGSTSEVLYVASGSSADWAFNDLDLKVSYTIEFRDNGRYGFVLPPVNILPNCEELMAGMKALVQKAEELKYV